MNGLEQFATVLGVLTVLGAAIPKIRHAVWAALCTPGNIQQILGKLGQLDDVKASADMAVDEWRGATAAVQAMADGHAKTLRVHGRDIRDLQERVTKLEGDLP